MNRKYIFILCLFFLPAIVANGQSFNGTINPTVNVQTVMNLTVVQNIASLTFSTLDQFSNGITVNNYSTIQIKSNSDWIFSVKTGTEYFAASGASSTSNMPASILQMAAGSNPTYFPLGLTAQQLAAGSQGDLTETGNLFNVHLKANPGFEYGPGTYSITITYTITAF